MPAMKILVTGCAGFIGFHLSRRLLAEGHTVMGIDNLNDYYDPALKKARLAQLGIDHTAVNDENLAIQDSSGRFTFVCIGIEDKAELDIYIGSERFDVVCHLAAQAGVRYSITNPQAYITANIQGFFNIAESCRRNPVGRFVFASSSSVYGDNESIPYRESDPTDRPVSLYGATKKANEMMAYSLSRLYGIDTVALRFFTVYGPWGRPDMAPFLFTEAILEGRQIEVFNNGNLSRDFTYIDDIIEGVYRVIMEEPATGDAYVNDDFRIYNIGNSQPVKLADVITTIEDMAGQKAIKKYVPMQPGDVKDTWADTTLLQQDFGYKPGTSLRHGLRKFIDWYREFYSK